MTSSTADRVVEELAPFKLKQVDDRTYRCNNPWRPGSNSQAFTLRTYARTILIEGFLSC